MAFLLSVLFGVAVVVVAVIAALGGTSGLWIALLLPVCVCAVLTLVLSVHRLTPLRTIDVTLQSTRVIECLSLSEDDRVLALGFSGGGMRLMVAEE